jgi:hypothetical protein
MRWVTIESDWRVPSVAMRVVGIIAATFIAIYGAIGVLRKRFAHKIADIHH